MFFVPSVTFILQSKYPASTISPAASLTPEEGFNSNTPDLFSSVFSLDPKRFRKSKGWNAEHSLFPCFAHILKVSVQASLGDETFVWIVDRVCSLATVPLMYQCLSFRPNLLR
jgi:hypothetical protein